MTLTLLVINNKASHTRGVGKKKPGLSNFGKHDFDDIVRMKIKNEYAPIF